MVSMFVQHIAVCGVNVPRVNDQYAHATYLLPCAIVHVDAHANL